MPTRTPAGRPRPLTHSGQRGNVSAELAIGTSVLILIIFGLVQLALWLHAVNIAQAAAQEGARAARTLEGSAQTGHQTAQHLAHLGPQLKHPQIQVTRAATTTRAEIAAHIEAVAFGLDLPVRAVAKSPTERPTQPAPVQAAGQLAQTPGTRGALQR